LASTIDLAKREDWHVVMAVKDFSKGEAVAKEAGLSDDNYTVMHCDLASNNSVRQFVKSFRMMGRPLDVLVCNAAVYFPNADKKGALLPGLWAGGGPRWSADGHELSFAANYLGHFLLVNLLLPDLQAGLAKTPGRCVILGTVTASVNGKDVGGMIPPVADVGDFDGLKQGMKKPVAMVDGKEFIGAKAYKDSKVCCVMLMRELHKRYHASTGVVFSSLYPGCITDTGLFREHYPAFRVFWPLLMKKVVKSYVSNEEAGSRLAKCVADPLYSVSGSYFSWGGESGTGGSGGADASENTEKSSDVFGQEGSFRTLPVDEIGGQAGWDGGAEILFDLSEKLVGLTATEMEARVLQKESESQMA